MTIPARLLVAICCIACFFVFAAATYGTVALTTLLAAAIGTSIVLSFWPGGYGRFDGNLGVVILLFSGLFGLVRFWHDFEMIYPADRRFCALWYIFLRIQLPESFTALPGGA